MIKKILISVIIGIFAIALYTNINALPGGIVNLTRRAGNTEGCTCHGLDTTTAVQIKFNGPSVLQYGDTATYTVQMTGGPLLRGGIDISAGRGLVILSPADTTLKRLLASVGVYELTHKRPKIPVSDTVTFTFMYVAPMTGDRDTLFSTGNSVNHDGTNNGDFWNFGQSKVVYIGNIQGITENTGLANNFKLSQNYPNPFNPSTVIRFHLPAVSNTLLKVYDVTGKEVETLVNGKLQPGAYSLSFDGSRLTSGVYFYRITAGDFTETKKMFLLK